MKNQVKIAVLLAIFLFAFPFVVVAGTVSTASLSPADISMTAGSKARISFSALNDSGLALKNYNIRISYTAGITVSNLTTDPPAATASVNTQKRYIDLVWSDIPPGTVLQAFFDIQGAQGTYTLSPGISTYRDIQNGRHTGTCNGVSIHISTDITPLSPPLNVRSTVSDNAVTISWNAASGNNITGYRLYRRTHDTSYSETQATDIFGLTFKDLNITPGVAYYYAVKSVDAAGNRSVLSQETAEMVFENQILKTISSPGDIKTAQVGDVMGMAGQI